MATYYWRAVKEGGMYFGISGAEGARWDGAGAGATIMAVAMQSDKECKRTRNCRYSLKIYG